MQVSQTTVKAYLPDDAAHSNIGGGIRGSESPRVTVSRLIGTGYVQFTFDAPAISFKDHYNLASSSDKFVSVFGLNFARLDLSPSVFLGDALCHSSSWTASTLLVCATGFGSGGSQHPGLKKLQLKKLD